MLVPDPAGGAVGDVAHRLPALGVPAGALVIDAGCGIGRYARRLAGAGFRVIGVDRSPALIDEARAASPPAAVTYVCADLAAWRPPEAAGAVLCRGVLNDLLDDRDRHAAFAAFAAWLCPDGVLLADARDWQATAARYAVTSRHERSATAPGRSLAFTSETVLDHDRRRLLVRERYTGVVDGAAIDERHDFAMRPWTADELRAHALDAGFADAELQLGAAGGLAPDRLQVIARR